jgi:hypothetical protein
MKALKHELRDVNAGVKMTHVDNLAHLGAPRLSYSAKGTNHNKLCVGLRDLARGHHLADRRVYKIGVPVR